MLRVVGLGSGGCPNCGDDGVLQGERIEELDELHLTQLNLVLLNNFYKQIYEGGKSLKPLSIVITVITIVSTLDYEAHNCTFTNSAVLRKTTVMALMV